MHKRRLHKIRRAIVDKIVASDDGGTQNNVNWVVGAHVDAMCCYHLKSSVKYYILDRVWMRVGSYVITTCIESTKKYTEI